MRIRQRWLPGWTSAVFIRSALITKYTFKHNQKPKVKLTLPVPVACEEWNFHYWLLPKQCVNYAALIPRTGSLLCEMEPSTTTLARAKIRTFVQLATSLWFGTLYVNNQRKKQRAIKNVEVDEHLIHKATSLESVKERKSKWFLERSKAFSIVRWIDKLRGI